MVGDRREAWGLGLGPILGWRPGGEGLTWCGIPRLRIWPRPLEALEWKCIYTLNNTCFITSVSQLLVLNTDIIEFAGPHKSCPSLGISELG